MKDKIAVLGWLIVLVVICSVGTLFRNGCGSGYSQGFKSGNLREFTVKGIHYKSGEGQLQLSNGMKGNARQLTPDTWSFSTMDPTVIAQLNNLPPGAMVTLTYTKFILKPWSQDSAYTVTGVRVEGAYYDLGN